MNKAKKYYVDKNGNMIYKHSKYEESTEVSAAPFNAKLKLDGIGWSRSGCYFLLTDENGKIYYMNDVMFRDYIEQHDVYLEGEFNFYQQGQVYSIG